ncbi:MAG: D-tyrosyl-tRNA(Tyr) deacylase [Erysipelothrix sp.]|nr:D-tyrosyl-tRNA(Tyr) deacylase [Erysipelothrix sp.]
MRVLIQKVSQASVIIEGQQYNKINEGLVLFVGFNLNDNKEIIDKMVSKIVNLRILEDEQGKTNESIMSRSLEILSISQFTLYAETKKGRRPSFSRSANSNVASNLYDYFNQQLNKEITVKTGLFQADMDIKLVNNGPFTIMLDSEDYGWEK